QRQPHRGPPARHGAVREPDLHVEPGVHPRRLTSRVTTARTHGAGRRRLCAYAGTRFVVATAKSRRAVALTPTIPGFDPRPRRAVVVRGGWDGHQPVEATEEFIPHLREHGFDVEIFDSPAPYADADLMAQTDLVVQCNTMSTIEPD